MLEPIGAAALHLSAAAAIDQIKQRSCSAGRAEQSG